MDIKEELVGQLSHLSADEREALEVLFFYPFRRNEFGYTLFGDKPMSFCILPRMYTFSVLHLEENKPFLLGLDIWKKIQKNFNNRYLFFFHKDLAFIINKPVFTEIAGKYLQLIQKAFNDPLTPDQLIEKLEKDPRQTLDKLLRHSLLLGVLLGYGEHNARLFGEANDLRLFNARHLFKPEEQMKAAPCLSTLNHEDSQFYLVANVNFAVDPYHPETQQIRQKYRVLHNQLTEIYSRKDWLEITLFQLLSDYTQETSKTGF